MTGCLLSMTWDAGQIAIVIATWAKRVGFYILPLAAIPAFLIEGPLVRVLHAAGLGLPGPSNLHILQDQYWYLVQRGVSNGTLAFDLWIFEAFILASSLVGLLRIVGGLLSSETMRSFDESAKKWGARDGSLFRLKGTCQFFCSGSVGCSFPPISR